MRPPSPLGLGLACVLTATLLTGPSPLASVAPLPATPVAAGPTSPEGGAGRIGFQTSDRMPGEEAAPRSLVRRAPRVLSEPIEYAVGAGVVYRTWQQVDDPARDPYTVHVLDVDLPRRAVRMDLVSDPSSVRQRRTMSWLVGREPGAVGGVNGDFFDIADTGAALGNSRDAQRTLLGARRRDWTRTFWIDQSEVPHIGDQRLWATITQRRWEVSHFNSPTVFPDRIGIYTPAWGRTAGARVTDGRTRRVREVVLRNGRVVANRRHLSSGARIRGRVLIGRGAGADRLARLRIGSRPRLRWRLGAGTARVAIGGSHVLLRDGALRVSDDVALHPRTAVGIDRDSGHVLLVTVDGRSESSSGVTMLGLAQLMGRLGAEDALNLDGGGSSTMVGSDVQGGLQVLNAPSDGSLRPVPNGLAVFAPPPA